MNKPLFSIIIPTRERHQTLEGAIQSVLNQSYENFELIIMDNMSSGATKNVVNKNTDSRIKYFYSSQRLSMTDNWELGLSKANGEYVFILGDDDGLMPDGIENGFQLIKNYQVEIVSWFRSQYWWPESAVKWNNNRLFLNLSQVLSLWNSRDIIKLFYQSRAIFENLPMIYNSFIHRDVIARVKNLPQSQGRYFNTYMPDVYSGLLNAHLTDKYLYSFRSLSLAGLSKYSNGTAQGYPSLDNQSLQEFIKDDKKDYRESIHSALIKSSNQEIAVADVTLKVKEIFFAEDEEIEFNIENFLNLLAGRINRDPASYEKVLADIEAIAAKHNINRENLKIPVKNNQEFQAFQGFITDQNGIISNLVINCEQVGVTNVAQAAKLAQGILPKFQPQVLNQETQTKKKYAEVENRKPIILIDGVFFQLYSTGIARVWRSLLEEWADSEFANYFTVLDRANSAPKIPGIYYRTIAAYDYNNLKGDSEMLQQVCDEEQTQVFISTYYTTPLDTPSVFMAYDMIPEILGSDLTQPMWQQKHTAIQHASAYISISANTAQDLAKFFPAIDVESVTVAHCGVQKIFTVATEAEINAFKHKYGITKPYFIVMGVGGYKNPELFYQALAKLPTKSGFEVVATGAGGLIPPELRELIPGVVVHRLQLSDSELRLAYAGAVALVYPSIYEGFGLPVLEAMSCGTPVITSPNASIPEVGGDAVIYVNHQDVDGLAEALCEVQKPKVREDLINAGLQQAQQFSWAKMAQKVQDALIDATLLPLNLRAINLLVFPDWSQSEEELYEQFSLMLQKVATHPEQKDMTLLIDTQGTNYEDANLLLSNLLMNFFMTEDISIDEDLQISLVPELSSIQWSYLLTRVQGRIELPVENRQGITEVEAENLTTY